MASVVVLPDAMDPVARQRVEWGQNIAEAMETREWSRKRLIAEVATCYGIAISDQSLAGWLSGKVAPRPDIQAALAGVFQTPHHLLFPPIKLERKAS